MKIDKDETGHRPTYTLVHKPTKNFNFRVWRCQKAHRSGAGTTRKLAYLDMLSNQKTGQRDKPISE